MIVALYMIYALSFLTIFTLQFFYPTGGALFASSLCSSYKLPSRFERLSEKIGQNFGIKCLSLVGLYLKLPKTLGKEVC